MSEQERIMMDARRLAQALESHADDDHTVLRMSQLLQYEPGQLRTDMKAIAEAIRLAAPNKI